MNIKPKEVNHDRHKNETESTSVKVLQKLVLIDTRQLASPDYPLQAPLTMVNPRLMSRSIHRSYTTEKPIMATTKRPTILTLQNVNHHPLVYPMLTYLTVNAIKTPVAKSQPHHSAENAVCLNFLN